jgi:hypothetical protein
MLSQCGRTPEGLARGSRMIQGTTMPFRARIVASAALVAAGFLLAPAAHASSRPPVQVNGIQLKSALLSPASFGSSFQLLLSARSGKSLWHQRARNNVSTMNCGHFESGDGILGFGESAVALSWVINPDPWPDYPNTQFYYTQSVYQFPSTKAATAYYNQARAKYAKCQYFTESVPADSVPGSGTLETTTQTMRVIQAAGVLCEVYSLCGVPHNKNGLSMKGFSYHTQSSEQAIACIIPPGSTTKKSSTSASASIPWNVKLVLRFGRHASGFSNR